MKKDSPFRRAQLDQFFQRLKRQSLDRPKTGWVSEIRNALGMSMEDLASRMGTIKQRIARIQKDELSGKVTLETLQKAAHAMECDFVYFFVPKTSLEETLEEQFEKMASSYLKNVEKTMLLEKQGIDKKQREMILKEIRNKIAHGFIPNLWRKS